MIIKHIQHQLKPSATAFFTDWLAQLKQAQQATAGFNQILVGKQAADSSKTHLLLQFTNQSGFECWLANPMHIELLRALKPHLEADSTIEYYDYSVV